MASSVSTEQHIACQSDNDNEMQSGQSAPGHGVGCQQVLLLCIELHSPQSGPVLNVPPIRAMRNSLWAVRAPRAVHICHCHQGTLVGVLMSGGSPLPTIIKLIFLCRRLRREHCRRICSSKFQRRRHVSSTASSSSYSIAAGRRVLTAGTGCSKRLGQIPQALLTRSAAFLNLRTSDAFQL